MAAWFEAKDLDEEKGAIKRTVAAITERSASEANSDVAEAEAALDIRLSPGEDGPAFLETLRQLINDPQIELVRAVADIRPAGAPSPLTNDAFKAIEAAGRAIRYTIHSYAADRAEGERYP